MASRRDDRAFLLRTSILGRMNGPLCDAVTGMTGSAARLVEHEKANLFIVPLDDSGTWFRFHRLFAELLRSNLASEALELELELHPSGSRVARGPRVDRGGGRARDRSR